MRDQDVGARFVGVANFREWRRAYPTSLRFATRRIVGNGSLWDAEHTV